VHILLIHQAFAALDEPGGTRHHELARLLVKRGHRVTIIASPISYLTGSSRNRRSAWVEEQIDSSPALEGRLTILRSYTYPALHRSFVHRIFSFLSFMLSSFMVGLRVRRVDVVWGTSPPIFQGVTAWALARLKRAKFLFEVRDLWPAFAIAVEVLKNRLLIRLSEWLERFLYRKADLVMVNSPGFREHVVQRGARRIALIPNGADISMFHPELDGQAIRNKFELSDKFVVLYAGAHGLSNDLGVVLEAASLLKDRSDIRLVLLGDGKDKPKLQDQAAALGLSNLLFLPPVPKEDMAQALAAADACIAILKPVEMYKSVYPNKVFDYMAAGRPVILAIDGVIREVVEEAQAGIFVQPGNPQAMAEAIQQLADLPDKGRQMGLNARKHIEQYFDRARLADRLENLLIELLSVKIGQSPP
jgi:glycosyltransferase involved in cell wall biosynthesis